MAKINSRKENMCMFCEYWLGKQPDVNIITGMATIHNQKGLCKLDDREELHSPCSLCHRFVKSILYL